MNKVAVITGATSGIGEAIAMSFGDEAWNLVLTGRNSNKLNDQVKTLSQGATKAVAVSGDMKDESVVFKCLSASEKTWGLAPDLFVLSAGRGLPGTLLSSNPDEWEDLLALNYLSVMKQLRACGQFFLGLKKKDTSTIVRDIVVIGSTAGRQVSASNPVYGSTKFALHSLVESLRQELCEHMIRVTLIEPGFVKSNFQKSAGYDMKWFDSIEEANGPLLEPVDVARVVTFIVNQPPHVHLDDIRIRPTRQKS